MTITQTRVIDLIPDLDEIRADNLRTVVNLTAASYEVTQFGGTLILLCDCTANAIEITLQTAVANPVILYIKKVDSSANDVTILTTSSQTIDGVEPVTISAENESLEIVSNNANWKIVADVKEAGAGGGLSQAQILSRISIGF